MTDKEKEAEEFAITESEGRDFSDTDLDHMVLCFNGGWDACLEHLRGRLEPVDFDEISDKDVESLVLQIQALKQRIAELENP